MAISGAESIDLDLKVESIMLLSVICSGSLTLLEAAYMARAMPRLLNILTNDENVLMVKIIIHQEEMGIILHIFAYD